MIPATLAIVLAGAEVSRSDDGPLNTTPEDCTCSDEMKGFVSPTSTWREIDTAAIKFPGDCADAYLDERMGEAIVDKLIHDWEGFCDHTGKRLTFPLMRLVMTAIDPALGADRVCAVKRLLEGSCPEKLRLNCKFILQKVESAVKGLEPPGRCDAGSEEQRSVKVFQLKRGATVSLTSVRFEGGRHELGRTKDGNADTINGTPSYGIDGNWPRRKVVAGSLKLGDNAPIDLDVEGMYDPGADDSAFVIERNGAGESYILKARLGSAAGAYAAEWMIDDRKSVRTSLRRDTGTFAQPVHYPGLAQLQADLPSAHRDCEVEGSSPWGYDSAGLDVVVRLRCPAKEPKQLVLRYAGDGTTWTPLARIDPFPPKGPAPEVYASTRAQPSTGVQPAPARSWWAPPAPARSKEPYPSAEEQRSAMGSGAPPPKADMPAPNTTIDGRNVSRYADRLGPALAGIVSRGARLKVGKYRRVSLPYPLLAATRKYAGSVALGATSKSPEVYVAGLPFPEISADDPEAALKLVWNHDAATAVDDLEIENVRCDVGEVPKSPGPLQPRKQFLVGNYFRMYFIGRLELEPRPMKEPNRNAVRFKEALFPLIEPFDLKGVGSATSRYLDSDRQDDTWLYLPQLRRVRRLSDWQRSDALFQQHIDLDSYGGFSAKPVSFEWRVLGESTTLASLHDDAVRDKPAYIPATTPWEPRRVWVLEGRPRVAQYAYSRRVLYLDKESYRVVRAEMYDPQGQLWKGEVNSFRFPEAIPKEGTMSVMADMGTLRSTAMVDILHDHATVCDFHAGADGGGWYINTGRADSEDRYALRMNLGGR